MEQDQELIKFVCKLCDKKYPCGKSLGGHMRSHHVIAIANSAESDEKLCESNLINNDKVVDFGNGQTSYGLRENPKKTWRAVDSNAPLPLEKICKQCGKGFQSLKALCGHMACHSDKDKVFKDDTSWTSDNQKMVLDSFSDTEEGDDEVRVRTRSAKGKKEKKLMEKCSSFSFANNGSSVSEIDGQEQEELAICLMMLSRDSGNKSVVESSDNNSVVLETKSSSLDMRIRKNGGVHCDYTPESGDLKLKGRSLDVDFAETENSDSGYFLDECAKAESDVSVDGFRSNFRNGKKPVNEGRGDGYRYEFRKGSNRSKNGGTEYYDDSNFAGFEFSKDTKNSAAKGEIPPKRTKYECMNCGKIFKSFQALGGHRPCHKRSNAYCEPTYESGENSLDDSTDLKTSGKIVESSANRKSSAKNSSQDKKNKSKKNKPHACPFCSRVFKNGQALGGHKRSHFLGGHEETISHVQVKKPDLPDFIDLNLPAPEEDEEGQFFQW